MLRRVREGRGGESGVSRKGSSDSFNPIGKIKRSKSAGGERKRKMGGEVEKEYEVRSEPGARTIYVEPIRKTF